MPFNPSRIHHLTHCRHRARRRCRSGNSDGAFGQLAIALAAYISALCAKPFRSASAAEAPYLAENVSAMTKMMIDMGIKPSGDVDTDFVGMMAPHHQGAIEMAQAELRYGRNESLRRMAQEIIVTQLQEITAMRLALGQPLPSPAPSPDQIPPAATNNSQSSSAARQ
jgi:Domain of unknown function (DUF305)